MKLKGPKRTKQEPRGDYPVGYAKPPDHTRFKPGNEIGRKGGRPKGGRDDMTSTRKLLRMPLKKLAQIDMSKLSVVDASIVKLAQQALNGNVRAFVEMRRLAFEAGVLQFNPPALVQDELLEHEDATIADFMASLFAAGHPLLTGKSPDPVDARSTKDQTPFHRAPPAGPAPVTLVPGRPTVRRVNFGAARLVAEDAA